MSREDIMAGAFKKRWGAIVAALIIVLGGTTVVNLSGDDDKIPETITYKVDGPDKDLVADDKIVAGGKAPALLDKIEEAPEKFDIGDNLRGLDATPEGQVDAPLATPEWPGCLTRFTPVNFSNRTASIKGFAPHYTGSKNVPGWADMNSLAAFAANPKAQVSWHFLIDAEGHCYYMVPTSKKAWTIGNLNSQTINAEMIGTGSEPTYGDTAGLAKLGAIIRRAAALYHFPVRLGAVSNCVITKPGVITHWMGGACAGGHIDIKPYNIVKVVDQIAGGACGRACDLRKRNSATHRQLKKRNCGPPETTRSEACKFQHRRHAAIHAAAKREGIKL